MLHVTVPLMALYFLLQSPWWLYTSCFSLYGDPNTSCYYIPYGDPILPATVPILTLYFPVTVPLVALYFQLATVLMPVSQYKSP